MRGFAIIGLDNPKFASNVGGVLRAAHCYGAAQVNISGRRLSLKHSTNTPMTHRHTPIFFVGDTLEYLPHSTQVVAVDLIDGAIALPEFRHPERALYVFGAEDATLGKRITSRAQHVVYIPTRGCMNLATCVNVVLYDRLLKGGEFMPAFDTMPATTQAAFYRKAG